MPQRWNLLSGITAIKSWFQDEGIETKLSDAGKVIQQIVQTLGGFDGISWLAYKGIIELLNKISKNKNLMKSIHVQNF